MSVIDFIANFTVKISIQFRKRVENIARRQRMPGVERCSILLTVNCMRLYTCLSDHGPLYIANI